VRGQLVLALVCAVVWVGGVADAGPALGLSTEDLPPLTAVDEGTVLAPGQDAVSPVAEEGAVVDDRPGALAEVTAIAENDPPLALDAPAAPTPLAQVASPPRGEDVPPDEPFEEYDPWIKFNEKTFDFNYWFDRRVLKPVAKAYDKVVPDPVQLNIRNAFDNVGAVRRIINAVFQGRFRIAGGELGRFLFNTVVGVGGLFDVARSELGLEQTDVDTGQTLGVWGAGPGPYLVIPLLPPLTVRDGFGYVVDALMNPLTWIAPTAASIALTAERTVNERSLNLEAFETVEETVLDLYSAVRNGYLQRRSKLVEEGRAGSVFFRP
jgi:phospholipid-binding lipoprotein MlaA